jgi:hypothetical protein
MMKGIEFILLPIIAFIVYTRPRSLVKFSGSILGKILMIIVVIGAASHNQLYGIIAATAMVVILENNYEGFEVADISNILGGSDAKNDTDDEDDDASKDAEKTKTDADEADADAEEGDAEEGDAEEGDAEEGDAEEGDADGDADADAEEGDADADADAEDADGKEAFIGSLLSKIGITSSNERIDKERKLQQGKCSNEEFTKLY